MSNDKDISGNNNSINNRENNDHKDPEDTIGKMATAT